MPKFTASPLHAILRTFSPIMQQTCVEMKNKIHHVHQLCEHLFNDVNNIYNCYPTPHPRFHSTPLQSIELFEPCYKDFISATTSGTPSSRKSEASHNVRVEHNPGGMFKPPSSYNSHTYFIYILSFLLLSYNFLFPEITSNNMLFCITCTSYFSNSNP